MGNRVTIVKTDTRAKRHNATLKNPLPLEMLPKMNRLCGKLGHKWSYRPGRKRCTRHLCEVNRPYTPNPEARQLRIFDG